VDISVAPQQWAQELESLVTAVEDLGDVPRSAASFDSRKSYLPKSEAEYAKGPDVQRFCGGFLDSSAGIIVIASYRGVR